ncbi:Nn.00g039880.m01.CDS01 [Neocucurbitaria sp. VM-36]
MANSSTGLPSNLPSGKSTRIWYQSDDPSRTTDIAKEAFKRTIECLKTELKDGDLARQWLSAPTTMKDISAVLQTAQERYESKSQSRQRTGRWLVQLSSRITYYGKVFDVLAQHHPEYVSLAWGMMKFLFIGVINHETLVVQLAQALSTIGDVLPRTDLYAELYKTQSMQDAISQLYARIILFFQEALKWYNRGPAGRAFASIFKPFELHYEETVKSIQACTQKIEDIASAASRAELRDINLLTTLLHNKSQLRDRRLDGIESQIILMKKHLDDRLQEIIGMAISHKSITEQVRIDVSDMKPRIREIHFTQVIEFLKPSTSPEASLMKSQSLVERSQGTIIPHKVFAEPLRHLLSWLYSPGSSLFLLKVGPRAETHAKAFALGVCSILKQSSVPLIWHLSAAASDQTLTCCLTTLLKSLVFQALKYSSVAKSNIMEQLSISRIQDSHTDSEWLELLESIVSTIPKCFLIAEVDAFRRHDPDTLSRLISMLTSLLEKADSTGSVLRILIVPVTAQVLNHVNAVDDKVFVASINQAPIVPARSKKMSVAARNRSLWWRCVNVDVTRL